MIGELTVRWVPGDSSIYTRMISVFRWDEWFSARARSLRRLLEDEWFSARARSLRRVLEDEWFSARARSSRRLLGDISKFHPDHNATRNLTFPKKGYRIEFRKVSQSAAARAEPRISPYGSEGIVRVQMQCRDSPTTYPATSA